MGSIADDVAAAKASFSSNLASARQDAAITVAEAKSALLQEFRTSTSPSSPGFIPRMKQEFSDIAVKARKDFLDSMPDPKRVIKTENNIQFLADGTFNLITSTGHILYNITSSGCRIRTPDGTNFPSTKYFGVVVFRYPLPS